jgi:hypothetical protein
LTTLPPTANQLQAVMTANGSACTAAWIEQAVGRNAVVSWVLNANGEPIEGGVASTMRRSFRRLRMQRRRAAETTH